jgi:Abortive infection C-terminus
VPRASKRPRVYGDESKFRAALARAIARGEELLDQAEGVRNRIAKAAAEGDDWWETGLYIEAPWAKKVRRFFENTQKTMGDYLQEQFLGTLGVLARGLLPPTGKPRHAIGLDNLEPWLRHAVDEMQDLQAVLGVRRGVTAAAPAPARFAELHASGLVEEKVIADHAKDMLAPRTPKQLADAIGSAKEITEATLRAALDRLGEAYKRGDDLPALMRKWRAAVGKLAPPDPLGEDALDKALAALANLVTFVAEWRNTYGAGHGRTKYPPGLSARHARLAADAAETCVRFIVTTMDDLELLPP